MDLHEAGVSDKVLARRIASVTQLASAPTAVVVASGPASRGASAGIAEVVRGAAPSTDAPLDGVSLHARHIATANESARMRWTPAVIVIVWRAGLAEKDA